jgi:hypothetical protein
MSEEIPPIRGVSLPKMHVLQHACTGCIRERHAENRLTAVDSMIGKEASSLSIPARDQWVRSSGLHERCTVRQATRFAASQVIAEASAWGI